MGEVRAVLWDFGGVFTPSPFGHLRAVGDELGAPVDRVLELAFGPYGEDTDHPWHRVERGEIALEVARDEIAEAAAAEGIVLDLWDVLLRMGESGTLVDPDVLAGATRVKAMGLATAVVTNNVAEFRDGWRSLVPVDDLFDVVVDSSELGVRKPDPRIFERALALLGDCPADEAVFLDDYPGNVEAARRIGLHAVLVPERERGGAVDELFALLEP